MEIDELFQIAANHVRSIRNLSEMDMLKLYGLYKQAKDGPCNVRKPYIWDFTAKAKWENWKAVIHLSNEEAKRKYVDLVRLLDPEWNESDSDVSSAKTSGGLGVSVSIMSQDPEEIVNDSDKTVFDWCKEGRLDQLKLVIGKNKKIIDSADANELTLLHWAVDHGHIEITAYLLKSGCDINCQDGELQTPLHYAVTCDHVEVAKFLLKAGADQSIKDIDGNPPSFYSENEDMNNLFNNSIT